MLEVNAPVMNNNDKKCWRIAEGNCTPKFLCAIIPLQHATRPATPARPHGPQRPHRRPLAIAAADRRGDENEGSVISVATHALLQATPNQAPLAGVVHAAKSWLFKRSRQTC